MASSDPMVRAAERIAVDYPVQILVQPTAKKTAKSAPNLAAIVRDELARLGLGPTEIADEDDQIDEAAQILLDALAELEADWANAEGLGRELHLPGKHDQKSHGRPGVKQVKAALEALLNGDSTADPFDGFSRETLRKVAKARGITLERGESRDSIAEKILDDLRARNPKVLPGVAGPAADAYSKPTSTPTRMTKGQYTKLLKDEHVRLQMLDGKSEKEAKAAARPAATIDELKARNATLRNALRDKGVDYRTEEQQRTDDAEKNALLDEVQRLASAGGHDGAAKRAAAARMTVPELRKFVKDVKDYQQRQAEKAKAARESAQAQREFEARQATLKATDRQVDYILNLLDRRKLSGEGGGFMVGPTDRAGIAKMSRADASAYIDSLRGTY